MPPKKQPKKAPIKPTAVQEASPIPQEESEKKEEAQPIQPKPASPIKETKPVQNPKASPPKVQPHQEVDQKIDSVKKNSVDSLGEDKSSNNVIKLNQFNNFVAPKPPTQGGISEEEKKRLREMRFAGKNTSENTFEIIQVRIFKNTHCFLKKTILYKIFEFFLTNH